MSEAAKFIKIYDLKSSVSLQYQLIRVLMESGTGVCVCVCGLISRPTAVW